MITIPVRVCGDVWCDPEQFVAALHESDPEQAISIDLRAEGPSLAALGVLEELRRYCQATERDPRSIQLINAPNNIEVTEFQSTRHGISHFFPMSVRYWEPIRPVCEHASRFAMFVGRTTVARCVMMYELCKDPVSQYFRFSTMHSDSQPIWKPYEGWKVIEDFSQWLLPSQLEDLYAWWQSERPPSLDGKRVRDQYAADQNTNSSLLTHYALFHIELVSETYTLGETFFPTEKTVRPIMAAKPWLIYGPVNFVTRLREMGFQSYQDLWDESYDLYQGPERWQRIKCVIQDLCQMPDHEFSSIMAQAQDIALANRRILADLVLTDKSHAIRHAGIVW